MDEQREPGLPPGIEAAWGLRERPGKGPARALSVRAIVEAAVRIGAAEGLAAISMSRVAAEVGASPMALYRYVSSKDELMMLVMDAALGPPPEIPRPGDDWRSGLSRWAWAMQGELRRNPWVLRIPISAPPLMPNNVAWMEAALRCLRGTGLSPEDKMSVLLLVSGLVRSDTLLMHDIMTAMETSPQSAEITTAYGRTLAKLADPVRFPELNEIITAGVFDDEEPNPDYDFRFGLARILDGIEALIRSSS